jgi:hypothetical protein
MIHFICISVEIIYKNCKKLHNGKGIYVILNTYLLPFSLINFVAIHLNIKVMLFYFLFIKNIFFLYVYRSKNKGLWIPQQFFAVFGSGLRIQMLQVHQVFSCQK